MMAIYNFLLWTGLMSFIGVLPSLAIWPSYVIEEGETAVVPCIPKGDGQAFFWTEGEKFETSNHVASRVLGIPSSASERYLTASNGSLLIFGANREDEGTYYCRIASENTNCFGAVSVFVQVFYEFGIDECLGKGDCVLQVDPSEEMELTCSAEFVPSWISLKWYNGLNETISVSREDKPNNDSANISETIQVSHLIGSLLICQAVDVRLGKPYAKVTYVRLEEISELEEQFPLVALAGLVFVPILIVTIFKWLKQRKKKKRYREEGEEKQALIVGKDSKIKELEEESRILNETNTQLTNAFKEKDSKIEELEDESKILNETNTELTNAFKEKDSKLKKLQEENKTLKAKNIKLTNDFQEKCSKFNELQEENKTLKAKNKKLTNGFQEKDRKINELVEENKNLKRQNTE